ncbi:hypothetical protein K501DRAFT_338555 [Backusella circina FSU 941]|nr:hypothetical protein K501DRAFT_338555 [Backusella circina FSU 941]
MSSLFSPFFLHEFISVSFSHLGYLRSRKGKTWNKPGINLDYMLKKIATFFSSLTVTSTAAVVSIGYSATTFYKKKTMVAQNLMFERASILAKTYDKVRPGYVPIYITPEEHNSVNRFYKYPNGVLANVSDALKVLNYPRLLLEKPYANLTSYDVNECSKLNFLIMTLKRIKQTDCNLDVAVIASTRQTEALLANVLQIYDFQFKPLSRCFEKEPPVLGALVRFRKAKPGPSRVPNFKLSVDCIIAYDPAGMVDLHFADHFRGVYHPKPQVVSLACERTADLRICNYRYMHGETTMDGSTSLESPDFSTMALFCNVAYPKIKVVDRVLANETMSNELVAWMLRKDNTMFSSLRVDLPGIGPPSGPPPRSTVPAAGNFGAVVNGKRRASDFTDAATSNVPQKRMAANSKLNFSHHHVPPQRMALLRARIQTSFPLKGLKLPSLNLNDNILRGVDWLSGTTLISSSRGNFSASEVDSTTSRSENVGSTSHTPPAQSSSARNGTMPNVPPVSGSRSNLVTPSIHPSRLAMIEASNKPPAKQSTPTTLHTQPQELDPNGGPNANQNKNKNGPSAQPNESSMQVDPVGDKDVEMTPQNVSQKDTEDYISLTDGTNVNNNDTLNDSPMETDRMDAQEEGSDKSPEDSPQIEQESSSNGLNDFEAALERAHLELMRSLLGKGDEE